MILNINGVDYSAYINKKINVIETPRYIEGANGGTSINGTQIHDRVATKYDISYKLNPLTQAQMLQLSNVCQNNTVTVSYTSYRSGQLRTMTACPSLGAVSFFKDTSDSRIYVDGTITFEEC